MHCLDCGHDNPEQNRFCGMCGARLALTGENRKPETAPVEAGVAEHRNAAAQKPAAVASEYAPPRGYGFVRPQAPSEPEFKDEAREEPTTLSGPSFLGLSGPAPSEDESYSYLLEEEQPSRAGRVVVLLLLIALGVGLYLKWQPIKTWVVNTTLSHIQPPPERKAVPTTADATISTAQATPPAGETATGAPVIEQTLKPAEEPPKDAKPAENSASAGKATDEKPAAKEPEPPASKARAEKTEPAEDTEAAPASETKKPVAAKRSPETSKPPKPALPEGAELVVAGEKYLYGRGVPRNCRQAVNYFRAAADKHNPRAYSKLGSLYATGQCVPLDRATAYGYFSRALAEDRSNPYLERNLTMLWRDMSSEERTRATRNRTF